MKLNTQLWSQYQSHLSLYEKWFSPFHVDFFSLLQIGVGDGSSLRMWRDGFPNALIFGIDISQEAYIEGEPRITVLIGDGGDRGFLKRMNPISNLKIVIDDARHQYHQQIESFNFFSSQLPVGGLYVVEALDVSPQIIHYLKNVTESGDFSIYPHRKIAFLRKEK